MDTKKFCMKCGAELEPDAVFCSSCGTKQDKGEAAGTVAANTPSMAPVVPMVAPPPQGFPPQPQGYQQQPMYSQPQPQMIIAQSPKSMGLALILSFLFGPLGLLYATVKGGLI